MFISFFSPFSFFAMKKVRISTSYIVLLGGVIALCGCEKVPQTEVSPKSEQSSQVKLAENQTPSQAAWQRFVDRVERGEKVDPSGQYVAKGTKVLVDEGEYRTSRPKFDAATKAFAEHFVMLSDGEVGTKTKAKTARPLPDPCLDCPPLPPAPTVTSTFVSSVGQGGSGVILDLKVIYGGDVSLQNAGYIKINSDLNKGAGGAYIYFAFTRTRPLNTPEYKGGFLLLYSSQYDNLRAFQTKNGGGFGASEPDLRFLNVWAPTSTYGGGYVNADLNGGAGGKYIYSYQSKDPRIVTSANIMEIGVLSGNSDTIQPPAGWIKYGNDLNEGCGGDYIYLCYRY